MQNLQQLLDRVVRFLREQGRASVCRAQCAYRGPEGRMCAVGCLITNEFYSPGLEGNVLADKCVRWAVEQSIGKLDEESFRLLQRLQRAHDGSNMQGDWLASFNGKVLEIAQEFNLEVP